MGKNSMVHRWNEPPPWSNASRTGIIQFNSEPPSYASLPRPGIAWFRCWNLSLDFVQQGRGRQEPFTRVRDTKMGEVWFHRGPPSCVLTPRSNSMAHQPSLPLPSWCRIEIGRICFSLVQKPKAWTGVVHPYYWWDILVDPRKVGARSANCPTSQEKDQEKKGFILEPKTDQSRDSHTQV